MATVPPAPTGYAPTNVTQTSMHVNFDANGNGGSTVLQWQCLYSIYTGQDAIDSGSTKDFTDAVDLTGLSRNTRYYVYARGRNSVGWGPYSNRVTAVTLPKLPNAPDAPQPSSISQTQAYIHMVDDYTWEGTTRNREVGISTDPNTANKSAWSLWLAADNYNSPTLSGSGSGWLTGLSRWTTYYLWGRIWNDAGPGPWSPRASFKTTAYPPGTPTAVSIGNATQNSIQYHFDDNPDNGGDPSTRRQVGYGTDPNGPQNYLTDVGNYVTIDGLSRYTDYYVWARAFSAGGWSGWSGRLSTRTRAYVPAPPTPTSCSAQSQTEVNYTFNGNDDGGSSVIEWQIGYGTDPNNVQYTTGSDGGTLIGNLTPGVTWYFWSRGRNVEGWSGWSSRSQATTIAGARVRYNGAWHNAVPYVRYWGTWKLARPYVRTGGVWKKSG